MEFLPEAIDRFVSDHTQAEPELLAKLNKETWQKVVYPRMLSGHLQGRVLSMMSKMIKPSRILEIGTYTGYSAICLAEGLTQDGQLHTIDINEELVPMQERYFSEAGLSGRIITHTGNAMEIIPELKEQWDIVFVDADKENYVNYFHLVLPHVKSGGHILFDNVLWSGKVVAPVAQGDRETQTIVELCDLVQKDNRVENVLLPVRDGLLVARKK
jgi:caffeoyl-CoA O-methyltransferase